MCYEVEYTFIKKHLTNFNIVIEDDCNMSIFQTSNFSIKHKLNLKYFWNPIFLLKKSKMEYAILLDNIIPAHDPSTYFLFTIM